MQIAVSLSTKAKEVQTGNKDPVMVVTLLSSFFQTERIVVDALSSGRHVSTFQTLRLSAEVQAEIASLNAAELLRLQPSSMMSPGSRRRTREAGAIPPSPSYSPSPQLTHSGESVREAQESSAAAKQPPRKKLREMREVREQQWAAFNKTRPDPVSQGVSFGDGFDSIRVWLSMNVRT